MVDSGRHAVLRNLAPVRGAGRWATTIALLTMVVACSGDDLRADDAGAASAPPTDTDTDTGTPEGDDVARADDTVYAVGSRHETRLDTSRPTPALPDRGIEAAPDRTIDLIVLYPSTEGDPPTDPAGIVDGVAPPADTGTPPAPGPFPLLVFAHGWNGSGASLVAPARRWASAGYVVALPTFPLSREGIAYDGDLTAQPGDVSFVIDTLLARTADPDDPLAGTVDADRVAVGGHSLGSATVFGFQNSCCKDPRVKAIVAISGGPAPYSTGTYDTDFDTPMLLVHGAKDPGVASAISEAVYAQASGDVGLLLLTQADHTSHFGGEDGAILDRVLVAYLDVELGVDPSALEGVEAEVAASGRGDLRSRGS